MIFKRANSSKDLIETAELILNGNIFVHPAWALVESKEITWKKDPFNDGTWCFYLHSLDIVGYLMNAYELNENQAYLIKSAEIIKSWIVVNSSMEQQVSLFAWKDHSVANRIVNMIHFWTHYKDSKLYDQEFMNLFKSSLEKHGDFLENDENHTFSNNHGIFQDRSLIELAVLFPEFAHSDKWYEKAINRFFKHVQKDVSSSGVHLEHSDAYHIIVMNLFNSINEFLTYHNRPMKELTELIYKMERFLAYAYKPDGRIPTNGDSGPDGMSFLIEDKILNPELLYVRTKGKKGKEPTQSVVYKNEGVAIIRNNWQINSNQLYLRFNAAFHSKVHKHADDLSFLLSIGKTDFFVDSGKYNYKEKDEFRQYFRSTMAHNTITVNRQTYPIDNKLIGKSKITKFIDVEHSTFVQGTHKLYNNVVVTRNIIYLKSNATILIYDEIESERDRTYSQIFNIGENVQVTIKSKNNILLESKINKKQIELLQLNRVPAFKNYYGSEQPIAGWYSDKFNEKKPINQLQFLIKDKSVNYRTVINTDIRNGVKDFSVTTVDEQYKINITYKNNETQTIYICS